MNNKALSISLLMAAVAVFFVWSYVDTIEKTAKDKFGVEITVIKARTDIKEMDTINESMLELSVIPRQFLEPASVFFEKVDDNDKAATKGMKALAGAVAVVPIKKGEQITFNKLTEPSIRTGLSPQVAPGKRAIAVPVNEVTGVAKLVKPGDRVDLIAIIDAGVGKESKVAKTVLQDAVVLAVGRAVTNNAPRILETDTFSGKERVKSLVEDSNFNSVTLEVEPVQAQQIALIMANGEGSMYISLRNNDDTDRVNVPPMIIFDVLGPDAAQALQRLPAGRR